MSPRYKLFTIRAIKVSRNGFPEYDNIRNDAGPVGICDMHDTRSTRESSAYRCCWMNIADNTETGNLFCF